MFIWKATFIDFEENYHAYVYMRPTFIQHSRVHNRPFLENCFQTAEFDGQLQTFRSLPRDNIPTLH